MTDMCHSLSVIILAVGFLVQSFRVDRLNKRIEDLEQAERLRGAKQ